jgi:hypothetical protein
LALLHQLQVELSRVEGRLTILMHHREAEAANA